MSSAGAGVALALALPIAVWSLAGDIVDDAVNVAGAVLSFIFGPVIDFVRSVCHKIVDWLFGFIVNIYTQLHNLITSFWNFVGGTFSALISLAQQIGNIISTIIPNVVQVIWDKITSVAQDAFNALNAVASAIYQTIQDVRDWAYNLVNYVGTLLANAIDALRNWTVSALQYAADVLINMIQTGISNVIDFVKNLVANAVSPIFDFINKVLGPVAEVVQRAWGWLVWMATHPFTWWLDLWNELTHLSPRTFVNAVTSVFSREGSALEEWLTQWLGL